MHLVTALPLPINYMDNRSISNYNIDMTDDDQTVAKTLWTDTMMDILLAVLKANKPDDIVWEAVRDVRKRKMKASYLVNAVERKLGKEYAIRLERLIKERSNKVVRKR